MAHRTCARCKQTFPATTEFFRAAGGRPFGIGYYCHDCARARSRERAAKRPAAEREGDRLYYLAYMKQIHLACMRAYGGDPPRCACCGETEIAFLTLDHIDGDGKAHRAAASAQAGRPMSGYNFYRWLGEQGYPPGLQVLCYNCNYAKRTYRACPHETGGGTITRRLTELMQNGADPNTIKRLVTNGSVVL